MRRVGLGRGLANIFLRRDLHWYIYIYVYLYICIFIYLLIYIYISFWNIWIFKFVKKKMFFKLYIYIHFYIQICVYKNISFLCISKIVQTYSYYEYIYILRFIFVNIYILFCIEKTFLIYTKIYIYWKYIFDIVWKILSHMCIYIYINWKDIMLTPQDLLLSWIPWMELLQKARDKFQKYRKTVIGGG